MEDTNFANSEEWYKGYPMSLIRKAVQEVEANEGHKYAIASKYGVTMRVLTGWRDKFRLEAAEGTPQEEVAERMRLAANEYLCGLCTRAEAVVRHGVVSLERMDYWVRRVRKENHALAGATSEPAPDIAPMSKGKRNGSDEAAQLRQELESARMRVVALETLIEVAERELGVKIRKKPGTKQSGK